MTDAQLENSIRSKLDSDAQLKAAANIRISANASRNEATLSGTVDSQASRNRAVELAKSANAGLVITDNISVKPRELTRAEYTEDQARSERMKAKDYKERIGDSLDDAWIHTKIVAKLIGDATTPERKINVDVVNNAVTLRGTVDTQDQKSEAERIARTTEGVKSVNNQLKVTGKAKS
jgi:osmotically-inducible protein OsmY